MATREYIWIPTGTASARHSLRAGDLVVALAMALAGSWWLAYLPHLAAGSAGASHDLRVSILGNVLFGLPAVLVTTAVALMAGRRQSGERGADKEGKAFCPRVVGGFTLGLDVEVAIFHIHYHPSPFRRLRSIPQGGQG